MNKLTIVLLALFFLACKEKKQPTLSAQMIIDKSIEECGGKLYGSSDISFDFRDKTYVLVTSKGHRVMKRISFTDSSTTVDVRRATGLQRFVNDSLINLPDSLANKYSNSVNSVHYFAYLPYGLNDSAVNKELLGKVSIAGREYYKVKITFDQEGGGKDFEDTYIYWFNTENFKPDYLAYDFYVDGGGIRFREAYNERYVNGIRFVDYYNYEPKHGSPSILEIDSLFKTGQLHLLSKIELEHITVRPGNYN